MKLDNLESIFQFITIAHKGQVDKAGVPYVAHCYQVWRNLHDLQPFYGYKVDENLEMAALMHDVLEDTVYTVKDLEAFGVPAQVVDDVKVISKGKNESYDEYLERLCSPSNGRVLPIKMADLVHNSDIYRIPEITDKDINRNIKYHAAMDRISDILSSDDTIPFE